MENPASKFSEGDVAALLNCKPFSSSYEQIVYVYGNFSIKYGNVYVDIYIYILDEEKLKAGLKLYSYCQFH